MSGRLQLVMSNIRHDLSQDDVKQQIQSSISKMNERRCTETLKCIERHKLFEQAKSRNEHHRWTGNFSDVVSAVRDLNDMYDGWIEKQKNYYSTVRVVEVGSEATEGFLLVYGDKVDSDIKIGDGTGPFGSSHRAMDWFLKGGR